MAYQKLLEQIQALNCISMNETSTLRPQQNIEQQLEDIVKLLTSQNDKL